MKDNKKKPIKKREIIGLWFYILSLKIRNYFFTGVVVLIPIGLTIYLSKFLINTSSKILPSQINPNYYLPFNIPGLEIIISIIFITIIGFISLSYLGKKFLQLIDSLFKKIPLLGTFWSAIKQMSQSFKESGSKSKSVVLVEYPRKGVWAVGFATKENSGEIAEKTNQKLINVFVPTTPNPTSGFLLMFPKDDVIFLNMTFEEASKFIVSAGTTTTEKN
ncbi:DUF502 domain-containing protein [Candidatus Pelagibacter sp. HIMB1495]|jgi:uncharacterized membrane protein|uniref:DUF502 domain-containing protein n=1 Tax=unclassified Candidatus Pelagibacter TaxID=2647897 RepID=UPI003F82833E|tara:strand:- start:44 stop:700 length:657 start_codon:yes stop_codon:yes gene_type:complete